MKKTLLVILSLSLVIVSPVFAGKQKADSEKTEIVWNGKKVTGEHHGNINLSSGYLMLKRDKVVGGEFVVDMRSITNTDVSNDTYREKLVNHLRSDDFFSVEKYPEAHLKITEVEVYSGNKANARGDLTIKGKTHPINFTVEKVDDYYRSRIMIDRSRYNVRYGSNSFFDNLGNKAIEDMFTLDIKLVME